MNIINKNILPEKWKINVNLTSPRSDGMKQKSPIRFMENIKRNYYI